MEEKILFVLKNVLGLESATKALSQQNCDKWDSLRHLNLIRGVGIRVWCRVRSGGDLRDEVFRGYRKGINAKTVIWIRS